MKSPAMVQFYRLFNSILTKRAVSFKFLISQMILRFLVSLVTLLSFVILITLPTILPLTAKSQEKEKDPYVDSLLQVYGSNVHDTVKLETLEILTKYLINNDLDLLPKYCSLGIDLARKLRKPDIEAAFETNLGTRHYFEGNYEKAIEFYIKAYKLNESVNNELGMANALNNIGIMYKMWKNYPKALEYLDKANVKYKKLNKEETVYRNRSNVGLIYLEIKEWEKALKSFTPIMKYYEEKNNEPELAKAYNNTATAWLGMLNYSEAEKYLKKSYALNVKLNNKNAASVNLYNLAKVQNELGNYYKALQYLDSSRVYPEENNLNRSMVLIMKLYADIYENLNDYNNALIYYKKYGIIKDTIFNAEKLKQITELQTKYETERTAKENQYLTEQAEKSRVQNQTLSVAIVFFSIAAVLSVLLLITKTRSNRKLKGKQTELENVNTQLEKAKLEAEYANNVKSAFLANISHEIRTPLNAVIGFARVLENRLKNPEDIELLKPISISGKSLLALINDILDISKIEANKLKIIQEPVNIKVVIEEVLRIFQPNLAEKMLGISVKWDDRIPATIITDEIRIRQILFNLIGNAIKFTEQGEITIKASLIKSVSLAEDPETESFDLAIAVIDTGIGIPESQQLKLFEPFTQVIRENSHKSGGTGLGLAISKRLAGFLNGDISLNSRPGEGSTFTLILSNIVVAEVKKTLNVEAGTALKHPVYNNYTLLLMDDEDNNRHLIMHFLENTGIRILEARNGQEGFSSAQQTRPDLIMADLRMPQVDGLEFLNLVRKHEGLMNVPVVCVTASIADDSERLSLFDQFDDVLLKPVFEEDLFRVMNKFLPGRN